MDHTACAARVAKMQAILETFQSKHDQEYINTLETIMRNTIRPDTVSGRVYLLVTDVKVGARACRCSILW
jgi:hypothetical protein